ncbi:hypothetical protein OPV22_006192 [Ensete ventricosum]|uniref:Uncharacterized protein n=1 Tax=Ensete ventricosum TaxID=4639 RepID=A0AAV8RR69_ENSVE|nr:hypothetical protein OPV22_006192 [Ensete ventricosum]
MGGCSSKPSELNVASPHGPPADSRTIPDPAPLEVMTASAEDGEEPPLVDLSEPTGKSPTAVVDEELDPGISELTLVEETEAADTDGKEKPVAAEEHPQQ